MTKSQIEYILGELKEESGKLSDFPNIASICLDVDKMIYPSEDNKCYFDSVHELFLEYVKSGTSYVLKNVFSYDNISIIYSKNYKHPKNAYRRGTGF